ncbi:hypothetical protein FHS18_001717 [Paenibacillus phyllosphaerae]|uniref:Lipoprotein n=1 Tax=Paenibacillus phyllosphaerae TaxID=274593 RepID=A0A7W5AVN8_9BACL|nr:hypothetical protein [Paenibacillus phyllosphaerae]MBB3109654.1 hypothetical protein [Paenibacillus phyllosphaerae]
MKALRKPATVVLLAVLTTTLLAGCQEQREDSAAGNSTTNNAAASNSSGNSSNNSTDSEVIKEGTIPKEGNVILNELAFVHEDQTVALSDVVDQTKLERIFGKAEEITSHTYSADDGLNMDQLLGRTKILYQYPGLEIETFDAGKGSEFRITTIEITDAKYATIRNIKVGDSVEELTKAYPEGKLMGDGATAAEDSFRYEPVNYVDVMTFHIKDDKIAGIRISTLLD